MHYYLLYIFLLFISLSENIKAETGCISGNCDNGTGVYIYANGNQYSGEFKNGLKHGVGIFTYFSDTQDNEGREKYEGEFKDDIFHGFGINI